MPLRLGSHTSSNPSLVRRPESSNEGGSTHLYRPYAGSSPSTSQNYEKSVTSLLSTKLSGRFSPRGFLVGGCVQKDSEKKEVTEPEYPI